MYFFVKILEMEPLFLILLVYLTKEFTASTGSYDFAACTTPQYLYLGEMGVIQCTSEETFHSVYWYNSTDSINETPLIAFQSSEKSGSGYLSGEFDIFQNGSLLIRNVTNKEDHSFRVIVLKFSDSPPFIRDIRVHVAVKSQQPYPYIETCEKESFCAAKGNENSNLRCVVAGVRPPVNLTWLIQGKSRNWEVPSKKVISSKNSLYTTEITAMSVLQDHDTSMLLVCRALGPVPVVSVKQSMVIMENTRKAYRPSQEIVKHVTNGQNITLVCSLKDNVFIIWKKLLADGNWRNVLIVHFGERLYEKMYFGHYAHDGNGSLIVPSVDIRSKGSYMCLYNDGNKDEMQKFEVILGEPTNNIGWIIAVVILITMVSITVVILITKYWKESQRSKSKNDARTDKSNIMEDTPFIPQMQDQKDNQHLVLDDSEKKEESKTEAGTGLSSEIQENQHHVLRYSEKKEERKTEAGTGLSSEIQEKRESLLTKLRNTYTQLCTVLEAPCISSDKCSVNKVFVHRCFEILASEPISTDDIKIQTLPSHYAVLEYCFTKCSTLILIGEHGFGMLTLCLQMAYEWCEVKEESYVKNYDIFILLHLKNLKGADSLNAAIKLHLLSKAQLDEKDVDDLLMSVSSGLIVLYGFDELEESGENIVFDITSDELYSKFHFIVVTTKGRIPNMRHIQTCKVLLSGFNERAQNAYLKKRNMRCLMEEMNANFKDNPLLSNLCKIPFFFALYANTCTKKGTALKSITTLLKEMMSLSLEELTKSSQAESFLKGDDVLCKIAYEGFLDCGPEKFWDANEIRSKFDGDSFERYIKIGVLKEDNLTNRCSLLSKRRIRFRHSILLEWYAALYSEKYLKRDSDFKPTVLKLYMKGSQYMMCFLCGLYEFTLRLFTQDHKFDREFPMMCFLELEKGDITDEVKGELLTLLLEDAVTFHETDTTSYQTSTLLCLEKAQTYKNPIVETLTIVECLRCEKCSKQHLVLQSDLNIPAIRTLTTLDITLTGQILEGTKAVGVFEYATSCNKLRSLKFASCILAESYAEDCVSKLRDRKVAVEWKASEERFFQLDFKTGRWKDMHSGKLLSSDGYMELITAIASTHSIALPNTLK